MDEFMYLIRTSICIAVFYALYLLFFRNTTFFMINRFYLLGGLIFSFVIPALELEVVAPDIHLLSTDFITTPFATASHYDPDTSTKTTTTSMDVSLLLRIIYGIGVAFMIFRLFDSIQRVIRIKNRSSSRYMDNIKIMDTDLNHPFSFFNWIFLPKDETNLLILEHEKTHVRHLHWIDLLLVEITAVILWFNPIMIFYRRSVKIQHEYLADMHTTKKGVQLEPYLNCMFNQIQFENQVGPISHFYSQTIKNRILMMTKNKTSLRFFAVYLLFLPVVCALLSAFSTNPVPPSLGEATDLNKDGKVILIVDAGHGGQDAGARSKEGLTEKEFTLSMATRIQKVAEENGIKVILTRKGDEGVTLEERMAIAKRFSADIFISLHANGHPQNASASGVECFISESSKQFGESKRFAEQLISQLKTLDGIPVNGIKKSDFYVLKNNTIPAVVLELGYLSNSSDSNYLSEYENQKLISERIIAAVKEHSK